MSETEDNAILENYMSESKQKRRENCERYTAGKRVVSEKKKKVFSLLKLYL